MNGTTLSITTVRGWSELALALNALDHCLESPQQPGAPGPCASSYALGLVHALIADACAHTLGVYRPAVAKNPPTGRISSVDHFIGGAAHAFLDAIYLDPAHKKLITETVQADGLPKDGPDGAAGAAWAEQVIAVWSNGKVLKRIDRRAPFYVPQPEKHHEDPLNRGQGFYGQAWAGQTKYVSDLGELGAPVAPLGLSQADLDQAYEPLRVPPPERSERFLAAAREVKEEGRRPPSIETTGPQGEQLTVGTFWAYDGAKNIGTPPRLYNRIAYQVLEAQGGAEDPADLARLLALCNIAMANASIVAWKGKYEHAYARPVYWIQKINSEVQEADWMPLGSPRSSRHSDYCDPDGGGTTNRVAVQALVGATEEPSFTPNFPAYPSGHATFGGACFKTIELFFGDKELPGKGGLEIHSEELDPGTRDPFTGKPRPSEPVTFQTTDEMITEDSRSRILLGVHWNFDGSDGAAAGRIIGQLVAKTLYLPS